MKSLKAAVAFGVLALMFTATAAAQNLRASIPFNFRVADEVLPAGEYGLSFDATHRLIELRSIEGSRQLYLPIMYAKETGSQAAPSLVFVSYGKAHYLRTVVSCGGWSAFELAPSRAERESAKLASLRATTEIALTRAR